MTHPRLLPLEAAAEAPAHQKLPQPSYDYTDQEERELFRLANDIVELDPLLTGHLVQAGLTTIAPANRESVREQLGV